MDIQLASLLTELDAACRTSDDLEAAPRQHFRTLPNSAATGSFHLTS